MKEYVLLGTYTQPILFGSGDILEGKGRGIYVLAFDRKKGALEMVKEFAGIDNPSYLSLNGKKDRIYVVNELKEFEGQPQGAVTAFAFDAEALTLKPLSRRGTGGTDPCHVITDGKNTAVFVSNYMSGSLAVFPVEADGSIGERSQFFQYEGSSANPARQKGPHAHSLIFDKGQNRAFVPDLGTDRLMCYGWNPARGTLEPQGYLEVAPGSGPRHCVFDPAGRRCCLIKELTSQIEVLSYDEESGELASLQTVDTVVDGAFFGHNTCADICMTPDGRFLYGSNRGHDSLVCYKADPVTGLMVYQGIYPCGGRTPRNFTIDPKGEYLLCGNQDSDNIAVFAIDQRTGALELLHVLDAPTPVCLKFV